MSKHDSQLKCPAIVLYNLVTQQETHGPHAGANNGSFYGHITVSNCFGHIDKSNTDKSEKKTFVRNDA